jgi:class 3 adenylate cyclase
VAEPHQWGARLLVVDDNKVNRLLLSRNIELMGHKVTLAENGRVALQLLKRESFDLMLLDIEMPEMDGFQVLGEMAKDLELRDFPVIVTSSLEGIENVVRCIELGAEDYLTKPVNPVLLKARIGASLEKKRLRDQQKELVRRFATAEVAEDLQQTGFSLGGKRVRGSVLFADIREFTPLAESQPPEETIELLNTYYTLMFNAISGHGGIVSQIAGDGLMAVFGAPLPLAEHCDAAVRAALEMIELIELFNVEQASASKPQIRIGIGIASGEMVAGYTGTNERATYTCIGDTVNVASRLEGHTKVAERSILIDGETRAGLRDDIAVDGLGPVAIRGKVQPVQVFAVKAAQSP